MLYIDLGQTFCYGLIDRRWLFPNKVTYLDCDFIDPIDHFYI